MDATEFGSVAVRPLWPGDIEAVLVIAAESPQAAAWSRESYEKLLEQPRSVALVAEFARVAGKAEEGLAGTGIGPVEEGLGQQHRLAGFLVGRVAGADAEVLNLAIPAANRCRGYATGLLQAAMEAFKSLGAESVYLEVRQSNTIAIAFYRKHGFTSTGLRKGYYRDPDEPALTMSKSLK